jgi:hypothetical protein
MRQSRVLLASRYEVVTPTSNATPSRCFFGVDTTAGRSVVIRLTVPPQSRWFAAARGASHRYLAAVIDVLDNPDPKAFPGAPEFAPGTVAIVAEALRGVTLYEHLKRESVGLDRSVAWTLRIAEAVRGLHTRGAAHGALSTHSVAARAAGRAISPIVTQLLTPQIGAFAGPERLTGEGPSLSDDLWAIGVLLHVMVSGELPFRGASPGALLQSIQSASSTRLAGLSGPYVRELEGIVARFLAPQRRRRPSGIDDVIDVLDRWERRSPLPVQPALGAADRLTPSREARLADWDTLSFDDVEVPTNLETSLAAVEDARATKYATAAYSPEKSSPIQSSPGFLSQGTIPGLNQGLPASTEGARGRMNSESFSLRLRSRPRWGVLALLVALVGAGAGAAAVSVFGSISNTGRVIAKAVQSRSTPASAGSGSRTHEHVNPRKERDACVRSYFPTDAFATDPDLEFVCKSENLVDVTQQLNALAAALPVDGNDAGAANSMAAQRARPASSVELVVTPTTTTRTWQLSWYELLAIGIIQRNCCHEPPPIKLPATSGFCPQLQVVVTNIANLSTKSGDISSAVRAYDEAITCLMSQGRHTVYSYKSVPTAAHKAAFQQFLTHAAEMDAKRVSDKY